MQIRKNTWHYRIWKFTYFTEGTFGAYDTPPARINLCRYVLRIIFVPVPQLLYMVVIIGLALGGLLLVNVPTVLAGAGLLGHWGEKDAKGGAKMTLWHFPRVSFGMRDIPMYALVLTGWAVLVVVIVGYLSPYKTVTYGGIGIGAIVGLYVAYFIVAAIVDACRGSDGWNLFRQYLRARKQKVCPLVEFVETANQEPVPASDLEPHAA